MVGSADSRDLKAENDALREKVTKLERSLNFETKKAGGAFPMKIIDQYHEILRHDSIDLIELAGRTCYKSEDKITTESAAPFVRGLVKRKHEAMLEHGTATVRFITSRGVTHEIVRHRLANFAQESQRYVSYDCVEFIRPVWMLDLRGIPQVYSLEDGSAILQESGMLNTPEACWWRAMLHAEASYRRLLEHGWKPEHAREVLPNSTKTEIVVTANYRQWRHILALRAVGTTGRPHPQMQALMRPLLQEFAEKLPPLFEDLVELQNQKMQRSQSSS